MPVLLFLGRLGWLAPPGLHWFAKEESKVGKVARGVVRTAVMVASASDENEVCLYMLYILSFDTS